MTKYKNKYRIASARWSSWDYTSEGAYFITICTKNRLPYFGEIRDGKMKLSPVGVLADVFWHEITRHFQYVELDAFVVMPNHVHGILLLKPTPALAPAVAVAVQTLHATSPTPAISPLALGSISEKMSAISPQTGSVSAIIRSYKSAVSRHAHRLGFESEWQERFHDHVIRNESSFERIARYISNNVQKWEEDRFFADRI